jgi:hypothetical protein
MDPSVVFLQIVAPLIFGAVSAAIYNQVVASRQKKATAARVLATLRADVQRSRDIADHNARLAELVIDDPRPFIRFPVDSYELLLFRGEYVALVDGPALDALMDYLHQARHINAMIHLFEEIETQTAGLGSAPLGSKKTVYVRQIGDHCQDQIPPLLDKLAQSLGPR